MIVVDRTGFRTRLVVYLDYSLGVPRLEGAMRDSASKTLDFSYHNNTNNIKTISNYEMYEKDE